MKRKREDVIKELVLLMEDAEDEAERLYMLGRSDLAKYHDGRSIAYDYAINCLIEDA